MTPFKLTNLKDLAELPVDTTIDVRAPGEFGRDHLPGAINLPVLDDTQRARVGTIYKQDSPFQARKLGGALVAQNTAYHLQGLLADKPGGWSPLIYCWRGGQRSRAFATILDQVGWRVRLLDGGYQSYRRQIVKMLYADRLSYHFVLIDGGTGTAKTALLRQLQGLGAQTLDLEALAEHRGSLFGAVKQDQPSQKLFESRLAAQLLPLSPNRVTFVEAESSKIGARIIPPSLWAQMIKAPRIRLTAPLAVRSKYLCQNYDTLTEEPANLDTLLERLRPYHAASRIAEWQALSGQRHWEELAERLISEHYDPRYAKASADQPAAIHQIDLPALDDNTLSQAAKELMRKFT